MDETLFDFSTLINYEYPLYIGSPWDNSVEGTINNLCIETITDVRESEWYETISLTETRAVSISTWNGNLIILTETYEFMHDRYSIQSIDTTDSFIHHSFGNVYHVDHGDIKPSYDLYDPISIQDEQQLYVVDDHALFLYDLTELSVEHSQMIPYQYNNTFHNSRPCVVEDGQYLYFLNWDIVLYDKYNYSFLNTYIATVGSSGCAFDEYKERIFIFGGFDVAEALSDKVYEYIVSNNSILSVSYSKLSSAAFGIHAINLRNFIYLVGGYFYAPEITPLSSNQIFNINSKKFEQRIIDNINIYSVDEVSEDVIYDYQNNALLRLKLLRDDTSTIYFLPIDPVAISFINTKDVQWRSQILINYDLKDYTLYDGLYRFESKYNVNATDIQYFIFIDPVDDLCFICEDDVWTVHCRNSCYFTVSNINTIAINVSIKSSSHQDIIILDDETIEVEFLKCIIHFNAVSLPNNYVAFTPEIEDICATNPLLSDGYITYINSTEVGIDHNIIVYITNNISCMICIPDSDIYCSDCEDGIKINITPDLNGSYTIYTFSKTTDLIVNPRQISVLYKDTSNQIIDSFTKPLSVLEWSGIAICALVIICVGFILFRVYQHNKKLKEQVKYQEEHTQIISNPLVISIGVAYYEDEPKNPDIDVFCRDLDGVDVDAENIKTLCNTYNYDLHPKFAEYPQLEWTQNEIVTLLQKCANKAANSDYDSVLAIFSGHGYKHNFLSSDYQTINKDAIHRLFACTHKRLRMIPRIFIFDCCDGEGERSTAAGELTDSDSGKHVGDDVINDNYDVDEKDIGKNLGMKNIKHLNLDKELVMNQGNADYKLVVIHAANTGFQSKLNSTDGSYLINAFVRKMLINIEKGKNEFLGDIMQQIQDKLHTEMGKQQTINIFNDNTRYIKFGKNNEEDINNDVDEPQTDETNHTVKMTVLDTDNEVIGDTKQHTTEVRNNIHDSASDNDKYIENGDAQKYIDIIEMEQVLDSIDDKITDL